MTANWQSRKIELWSPQDLFFSGMGVAVMGDTPLATLYEQAEGHDDADKKFVLNTNWDSSEGALQIKTEQLAFENREVVVNKYIQGKELTIEYNVRATNAYDVLKSEDIIRRRSTALETFSLTRTYTNILGTQKVEGYKDAELLVFNFTPLNDTHYTVKLTFKILDSRKYITEDGISYRMI